MRLRDLNYPTIVAMLVVFSCVLQLSEVGKIFPHLQIAFVAAKVFFILMNCAFAFRFSRRGLEPKFEPLFLLNLVSYSLVFMWFGPLYEIAYLQCALGTAFLKLRRQWLFIAIYGMGLIGIFVTYAIQDSIGWKLPEVVRSDWVWTMVTFFFLTWFIQGFAIGISSDERQRVLRFGLIGRETTRLIHDLKGLLSSPLALAEDLRLSHQASVSRAAQINDLAAEMGHVRSALHSIQRLVQVETHLRKVNPKEILLETFHLLSRRLDGVNLKVCDSREVVGDYERLQSVLFNLILNSLEAHRRSGRTEPLQLEWTWDKDVLVMTDNAGGMTGKKKFGSGLGLELAAEDMQKMGGKLEIKSRPPHTIIRLRFQ